MDIIEQNAAGQIINRHPWELARLDIVMNLINLIKPGLNGRFSEEGVILDIGCGDGFVAREVALRFPSYRVIGIDTKYDKKNGCKDDQKIPNLEFHKSVKQIDSTIKQADLVMMLDVLEHIEDDESFLGDIMSGNIFNADTLFFLTVPAHQALFSRHDTQLCHYRRYSLDELKNLSGKAGISIISAGNFFFLPILQRIFEIFIDKTNLASNTKKIGVAGWEHGLFFTSIVKKILISDFKFSERLKKSKILLPGLSCYLIGKKQNGQKQES
ncbi:class I SAM-dependent methyltransferase [Desulforegula conservatrix]|uniref:class I SAM-dependent methyltransferase n=1 Tax=Desulforegula conservatrix TaxID=153026 RepID=UPI00041D353A|nr:class I SAM-dependent methyltransferase [Desulforegula conservatrix]